MPASYYPFGTGKLIPVAGQKVSLLFAPFSCFPLSLKFFSRYGAAPVQYTFRES
jgi:hypothetical protein